MGYAGVVACEASSGARTWRGGITKTGNTHLRRIVVEAAWAYRHRPTLGGVLYQRQVGVDPAVREIAWTAQHRLHDRPREARVPRTIRSDDPPGGRPGLRIVEAVVHKSLPNGLTIVPRPAVTV